MRFHIDEAGSFTVPSEAEHRAAVAVGLAITDQTWPSLRKRFHRFVNTLPPSAFERSEPKGSLMGSDALDRFTELLAEEDGLAVCPVTMDLGHLHSIAPSKLLQPFYDRLDHMATQMIYPEAAEEIELLGRQAQNLSPEQVLRVETWSRCLYETLYHAIIVLSHGQFADSWESVSIEIDPVHPRSGNREEQFLGVMLFAWMTAWSKERPFGTVAGVHTDDHPFVRNFMSDEGIVLSDLIRPNLHWPSSDESYGLQMADIAASIVYQAAIQLDDNDGAITRYGRLMRSSPYGFKRGPGLISPLPEQDQQVADSYQPLADVMKRQSGAV